MCGLIISNVRTNKSKLGVLALHQSRFMCPLHVGSLPSIFYCPIKRVSWCTWMAKWQHFNKNQIAQLQDGKRRQKSLDRPLFCDHIKKPNTKVLKIHFFLSPFVDIDCWLSLPTFQLFTWWGVGMGVGVGVECPNFADFSLSLLPRKVKPKIMTNNSSNIEGNMKDHCQM